MSATIADQLFTPFVTGKRDGLGLGLGIARDIAREFGGELDPLAPAGRRHFQHHIEARMSFVTDRQIVFVDDDAELREANVQSLELAGLDVKAFADAAEALSRSTTAFNGMVVTTFACRGWTG